MTGFVIVLIISLIGSCLCQAEVKTVDQLLPRELQEDIYSGRFMPVENFALQCLSGNGQPKDPERATRIYFLAAIAGDTSAMHNLGGCYQEGLGVVRKDLWRARDWWVYAISQNYQASRSALAELLMDNPKVFPDDSHQGIVFLEDAANHGDTIAQSFLGTAFSEGNGTNQDLVRALEWLELGIKGGQTMRAERRDEVKALTTPQQREEVANWLQHFQIAPGSLMPINLRSDRDTVVVPMGNYSEIPVVFFSKTNLLIVDTSSSFSVLDESFQPALGDAVASIQEDALNMTFYESPYFSVKGKRLPPLITGVGNFSDFRKKYGSEIMGVLGLNALRRFVVSFDYDRKTLSIGPTTSGLINSNPPFVLIYPFLEKGFFLKAKVNNHAPIDFAIDTGDSAASLSINENDWAECHDSVTNYIPLDTLMMGRTNHTKLARLPLFELGSNRYTNLIVLISQNPSTIAARFLRRHICTFDFPNNRLYLEAGRNYLKRDEGDMSGVNMWAMNGQLTVMSVREPSPASKAGVKADDQIISINGQDVSKEDLYQFEEQLEGPADNKIILKIRRGSLTNEIAFVLERRI